MPAVEHAVIPMYPQENTCTYRCPDIAIGKAPKQIGLSWRVDSIRKRSNCERRPWCHAWNQKDARFGYLILKVAIPSDPVTTSF